MATIKPFRAVRPVAEKAVNVSSIPYDVAYLGEVKAYVAANPESFLRITRAEAECSDAESLERARANFDMFIRDSILIPDQEPAYYIYRLSADGHSQTGVVACCSIDEYEQGQIKRHERTRPDKVEDRTQHMLRLRAQTGLIFLAYRGTDEISSLVRTITAAKPLYDFVCPKGIRQQVWRVSDIDPITAAFAKIPALYIADGHHRLESASLARSELRKNNPDHTGDEEYNYVMAGMFPAEELQILAYNRVVKDLNGLSPEEFLARVGESFTIEQNDKRTPEDHGEICMYLGGKWYDLRFSVNFFQEPGPVERLDVSILQNYILEPVLGIKDVTTDGRIKFVGGARGTAELERLVDKGKAVVAFSLYPTTMDDLLTVSDIGEIMPPKSTWFEPKLKDGLFVHAI